MKKLNKKINNFTYWNQVIAIWLNGLFISNTFISKVRLKFAKSKQMLSITLKLDFCYLKIIHIINIPYHPKIIGHILKNKQNNKCVCIHEIIRLIIMKIKIKMKNRSHRHEINRPRPRHGHRYSKYRKCNSMMILICIKQHISNIWSSIHESVKQLWG